MNHKALFSENGQEWHDGPAIQWVPDDTVTKIVIGKPTKSDSKRDLISLAPALPENLAELYPAITHLYLWQIENLANLPRLPETLECLDARDCPKLTSLTNLPANLETLVLERCEKLLINASTRRHHFPKLLDLSLAGSGQVDQAWVRSVLQSASSLKKADLSACQQIERITNWPSVLVDIRMNDCTCLQSLPPWPPNLRRVELRNATRISRVPNFPSQIDYVDLAGTRSLESLPRDRGLPRTLYLYRSGVLEPPASEHGSEDKENVAADVADYFSDMQLTGKGDVRRCKLLILGNGDAGKTCLAMNLAEQDYPAAKARAEAGGKSISTHGVQFWDLKKFQANVQGEQQGVHLHLWDFGGQEIYHNTHRLFISKGTVFVIVWNPDQNVIAPTQTGNGYQDQPRSLQYWIDLIRRSCDHTPRFAIVCSRRSAKTTELENAWKKDVRPEFHENCRCFYLDSWEKTGEGIAFADWLSDEVGKVIATQGTAVPKYWEIAQTMVEGWVARMASDPGFAAEQNSISLKQFEDELNAQIRQAIERDHASYSLLASAIEEKKFELTPNRIRRTLNFLTRSGWIYWDNQLFEGRIIVGQQWALDGLYTVLERRKETTVFPKLRASDGRFTRTDLNDWVWSDKFSAKEQKLLISFMVRCGLCFRIYEAVYAWREEDLYVSFEHLPTSRELDLQRVFDNSLSDLSCLNDRVELPFFHKFDWQMYLIEAGTQYGPDADYADDGILFRTQKNQAVLITCDLDRKTGFGGSIRVQVSGLDASELLESLMGELRQRFPEGQVPGRAFSPTETEKRQVKQRRSVFISYAWNSAKKPDVDYEGAADAIEEMLLRANFRIGASRSADEDKDRAGALLRDKRSMRRGESIVEFMKKGAKATKVCVIHSDRYFESINCMFELHQLRLELDDSTEKSFETVVIPIELPSSGVGDSNKLQAYLDFWDTFRNNRNGVPARMLSVGWDLAAAVDHSKSEIRVFAKKISDAADLNLKWRAPIAEVLEKIRMTIGIPTETTDHD